MSPGSDPAFYANLGGTGLLLGVLTWYWSQHWDKSKAQRRGQIFTSGDADEDAPSVDKVFLDASLELLKTQIGGSDRLDDRIAGAFGVGSTVLPVTIGLLNLLKGERATLSEGTKQLLIGALVAYVVLIACATVSFLLPRIQVHPNATVLRIHANATDMDGAILRRWVGEEYARAVEENRRRVTWKGRSALGAILALYVEAILLSLAAFVTVT